MGTTTDSLAGALVDALDDAALDVLAERLAPRLAVLAPGLAPAEEWLTTREAAERAGVHVQTIRRAVRTGNLEASRLGGTATGPLRIGQADLTTWMPAARVTGTTRAAPPRRRSTPTSGPLRALITAEAKGGGCE